MNIEFLDKELEKVFVRVTEVSPFLFPHEDGTDTLLTVQLSNKKQPVSWYARSSHGTVHDMHGNLIGGVV